MRDDRERLADILDACERAQRIVAKGEEHVRTGDEAQLALVHLIQIMGEAATQLRSEFRHAHAEVPWREVAGMRNQVVHRYFDVDLDVVWDISTTDVPRLAEQVQKMLDETS